MINVYEVISDIACSDEEAEMFTELLCMLSLSGKELDTAMEHFRIKYFPANIKVGDECYYDINPEDRFIVTNIRLGKDGLDHPAYFFDGIYHDGRTISDGTLKLIHKTGNYYHILHYINSPFDEQPTKEKEHEQSI